MITFKGMKNDLKRYVNLCKSLYKDPRTPLISKILLWLAIGYFLMPFDIIPDFIPVIGHLDDAIIVPVLVVSAFKLIPKTVYKENYAKIFDRKKS